MVLEINPAGMAGQGRVYLRKLFVEWRYGGMSVLVLEMNLSKGTEPGEGKDW